MAGLLEGKVALVTGASSGIGRATAQVMAREGAKVVIAARRESESQETLRLITDAGGVAAFVRADVTDESQVEAMVRYAVNTYGRLDCAFNNAGGGHPASADWPDNSTEQLDRVFELNVKGVWLCMKHELKVMLAAGSGVIVNNSSIAGLRGRAGEVYASSKYAVNGLTTSAAVKYGHRGIRVNAVAPGIIHTDGWQRRFDADPDLKGRLERSIPVGRAARPEEVGEAVAWLCSDRASYIHSVILPVDGGMIEYTADSQRLEE